MSESEICGKRYTLGVCVHVHAHEGWCEDNRGRVISDDPYILLAASDKSRQLSEEIEFTFGFLGV